MRGKIEVKNKNDVLSSGNVSAKQKIIDIIEYAVQKSVPRKAIDDNLNISKERIEIFGVQIDRNSFGDIIVIGAGKASYEMAKGVEKILSDEIKRGLVVTKYGHGEGQLDKIEVFEAGHPIPDENSLKAARKLLGVISSSEEDDLIINLISGGGSALLCAPADEISLEDMKKTTDLLVSSNAPIDEINCVRKHISRLKGGKLALKAYPRRIISLIVSDVVGDRLEIISSGPTVYDSSTFLDAVAVLKRYSLMDAIPDSVKKYLLSSLDEDKEISRKLFEKISIDNIIVSSNDVATEAAEERAREIGLKTLVLSRMIEGESFEAGVFTGGIVRDVVRTETPLSKPCLIISGGETTVTLSGKEGLGGPNQEFALGAASKIKNLENTVVAAIDTDGSDGSTDVAGGIVDGDTQNRLEILDIDIQKEIDNHDSRKLLEKVNGLLELGPTGTNVNDLRLALVDEDKKS